MGKISKDAYLTGVCSIISAIIGAWCGSVFGQGTLEKEFELLKVEYNELLYEYEQLENEYHNLLKKTGIQNEYEFSEQNNVTMDTVNENRICMFDLPYFTQNKTKKVTYIKDVFGRTYVQAFKVGTVAIGDEWILDYTTEFFLDKQYSQFSCKVFFPEDAYENEVHQLLVWGDDKQLGVVTIDKKSGTKNIEINVENISYLQFAAVTEGHRSGSALGIIEPYLEE